MNFEDDIQIEAPPNKRARLENPQGMAATSNENDLPIEGISGIEASTSSRTGAGNPIEKECNMHSARSIPGLGLLGQGSIKEEKSTPQDSDKLKASLGQHYNPLALSGLSEMRSSTSIPAPDISQSEEANVQVLSVSHSLADTADSPSVTTALESLLGGLSPLAESSQSLAVHVGSEAKTPSNSAKDEEGSRLDGGIQEEFRALKADENMTEPPPSNVPDFMSSEQDDQEKPFDTDNKPAHSGEAEFELDSSPIQSSSEDDGVSDDSSSSEDSEGEDYTLLGPEEQARILMEGDGGSDDEGGNKGTKNSGAQLRTKNEVPEEVIPKPDVSITAEMKIEELGEVEGVVENILLIKAKTSGEYRVLESGSVLCLADRTVIGVVSETLGRVQQPLYSVRFTNADEIARAGITPKTNIYYSEQHSTYVFTQALKVYKGSDASNLHDEEVGDEEIEFSDDEAEAEHKRRLKQKKIERRGGKTQQNGSSKSHGYTLQHQETQYDPTVGLSYDDEDDGPYTPLQRPAGFVNSAGRSEAPQERVGYAGPDNQGNKQDNYLQSEQRESHDRGRGRGNRGRGRGDRRHGRGNFQARRNDGQSQPPYNQHNHGSSRSAPSSPTPPSQPANIYNYYNPATQVHYNPHQPSPPTGYPAHPLQLEQQAYIQQQYQYPQQFAATAPPPPPNGWANMAPSPTIPAGAYINPAFFGHQQPAASGQQWAPSVQQARDPAADRAFQEAQDRLNILKSLSQNRGPT